MTSKVLDQDLASSVLPYVADPYRPLRRRTREVLVGNIGVGGNNPIRIQSMTTTRTQDVEATLAQTVRLVEAGCEIVRITAPTVRDAEAIGVVRTRLRAMDITVPLVADIHFSPAAALAAAEHADKVRVNPGNFADSRKFAVREYSDAEYAAELARVAARFTPVVLACRQRGVALRIGTNHGSLSDRVMNRFGDSPEGMVESALEFVRICEQLDFYQIILSMKASNPKVMIAAYRLLVARMAAEGMDYPLHLGVTEAGNGNDARIKSAVGIGSLLLDGLGDTIRVSLAEEPEEELPVARAIVALCQRPFPESAAEAQDPAVIHSAPFWDPYHYTRRPSHMVELGALRVGGGATVAVVGSVPPRERVTLPLMGGSVRRAPRPDLLVLELHEPDDLARLREVSWKGQGQPTRPLVARSTSLPLLHEALPLVQAICLALEGRALLAGQASGWAPILSLASSARQAGLPLWLDISADDDRSSQVTDLLRELAAHCAAQGFLGLLLTVRARDVAGVVGQNRLLATGLAQDGLHYPLVLATPPGAEQMLAGAAALGSLLSDGLGDAVWAETAPLAFDLLQGAGARLTRTDYVACPSCGRTLFDLQSTTDRIKARTSHLKGVKIAIMGCVVNGPGEMADADFGYMGGSPGQVNLYVGKECVERGVPEAEADERLIALIQAHGRWVEPGTGQEGEEGE